MSKPKLQARLQEALGLDDDDFHYHATDLYVLAKPGVMEWLRAHYEHCNQIESFTGEAGTPWEGKQCLDILFAGKVKPTTAGKVKPTTGQQSFKAYQCSKCGHEKEIQTNHWGECYSHGDDNVCPTCPPHARPTVWVCQEKPPETHGVAAPWTIATVEIKQ